MGRLNWNKPRGREDAVAEDPSSGGWEIPAAAAKGADPWLAPGNLRAAGVPREANPAAPFECRLCGASLRLEGVYARDGDIYCVECRPKGAVSSLDLPSGNPIRFEDTGTRDLPGAFVGRLLQRAWDLLRGRRRRIGW